MSSSTTRTDFDATDALAVHTAMIEAIAVSVDRRDRMPSSSEAIARQAERLKVVRNKILAGLNDRDRAMFPDYKITGELPSESRRSEQ